MMGRHGRDHVTDPAEQSARADPHPRRDDQPEDPAQEIPVVELAYSWNHGAEYRGGTGISHDAESTLGGLWPDAEHGQLRAVIRSLETDEGRRLDVLHRRQLQCVTRLE